MGKVPENGKESSHSAHGSGMNDLKTLYTKLIYQACYAGQLIWRVKLKMCNSVLQLTYILLEYHSLTGESPILAPYVLTIFQLCMHLILPPFRLHFLCCDIQGDQKLSVHLMITIQKVTGILFINMGISYPGILCPNHI
jgi:hypothetical protein